MIDASRNKTGLGTDVGWDLDMGLDIWEGNRAGGWRDMHDTLLIWIACERLV